jgi:hypothetical protein
MSTIVVIADAPVTGQALRPMLPYFAHETLAKLSAAMLRDSLDGLLALGAKRHVLLGRANTDEELNAFASCVQTPWEVIRDHAGALAEILASAEGSVVLAAPDAPSAATEPIEQALRVAAQKPETLALGCAQRDEWATLVFPAIRAAEVIPLVAQPSAQPFAALAQDPDALLALPTCHAVRELADIDVLFEELKRHPERAPWTYALFNKMDWGG